MTDSMNNCKSLNISTGTVMRNPVMWKFVPDHLKTKPMYKNAVTKITFRNRICS